jgi:hypothetical protein
MHRILRTGLVALAVVVPLRSAWAQPDSNYVPPKGGYDTPGSFVKPLEGVGETYERTLGTPLTNMYQRQVRLKALGLENLSRLSALKQDVNKGVDAEQKRQQASGDGKGGLLGGLLSKVNPLLSKEVERQQEVAKDEVVVRVVEAGSPVDTSSAAIADVMSAPNQVTGSFFGAKINNKVRVVVTTSDFKPRVLLMRHRQKGMAANIMGDPNPEFSVVASYEVEEEGDDKATVTFDRSKESTDGSTGLFILVTSVDGKATTGKYKIRWAPQS